MYVPDEYKTADGINEFRGIYLPYHSYDAEVAGDYDAYGSTEITKKKKKKIYTTKILENTRASSWLCKRYYT